MVIESNLQLANHLIDKLELLFPRGRDLGPIIMPIEGDYQFLMDEVAKVGFSSRVVSGQDRFDNRNYIFIEFNRVTP